LAQAILAQVILVQVWVTVCAEIATFGERCRRTMVVSVQSALALAASYVVEVLVLTVALYYSDVYSDVQVLRILYRDNRITLFTINLFGMLAGYFFTIALAIRTLLLAKRKCRAVLRLIGAISLTHIFADAVVVGINACQDGGPLSVPIEFDRAKLVEPLFEGIPSLFVQTYVLFSRHEAVTFDTGDTVLRSVLISIAGLSWSLASLERQGSPMKGQLESKGPAGLLNWRLHACIAFRAAELTSRFFSLALLCDVKGPGCLAVILGIDAFIWYCLLGLWKWADHEFTEPVYAPNGVGMILSIVSLPFFNPQTFTGIQAMGIGCFIDTYNASANVIYPAIRLIEFLVICLLCDLKTQVGKQLVLIVVMLSATGVYLLLFPLLYGILDPQPVHIVNIGGLELSESALVDACRIGDVHRMRQCLEEGVDVNEEFWTEEQRGRPMTYTALGRACAHGQVEVVKRLLAARAKPDLPEKWVGYFGDVKEHFPRERANRYPEILELLNIAMEAPAVPRGGDGLEAGQAGVVETDRLVGASE